MGESGMKKMLKLRYMMVFLSAGIFFCGGNGNGNGTGEIVEVEMGQAQFVPSRVVITEGQTVRWTNTTGVSQTVTADSILARSPDYVQLPEGAEEFDSGVIEPGGIYQRTFTVPGTYKYFSIPFQEAGMRGTIVVQPKRPNGQEQAEK